MRNKLIVFTAIIGLVLIAAAVKAQYHDGHEHNGSVADKDSTVSESAAANAVEAGNKICPVSSQKVGEMGKVVKYEYKGKVYNLCCAMCAKDFKKDPEKYSKIAEKEVKAKK